MIQQVVKTIQRYKMFEPGERVVVAVSGGPDSMALLHILKQLNMQLCLNLAVAHVDHRLRKDSASDLRFVRNAARSLEIPFYSRTLNWKKIKKRGSLEDFLRKLRYDFLFGVAKKIRATKIAVGHIQDDQAETVLMRILRGSGLQGLSAILPKRKVGAYDMVRPLIEVSRKEIMDYLEKNKIPYRIDHTNFQDDFLRNEVRHHLMPILEQSYNPNIKEVLSNLALTVGADYAYILSSTEAFLKKQLKPISKGYALQLAVFEKLDVALRRLVLRHVIELLNGDLRKTTFQHWQEVEDLLDHRPVGAQVHLPFDVTVSKTKSYLNIFKR